MNNFTISVKRKDCVFMEVLNKVKIMIVDDDTTNRYILKKILDKAGYEIREATNGEEALKKAESEKPNLIILDVNLPDITGYEVGKRLKANPITNFIQILSISSYYTKSEDWVHGLESGADNYLIKPVDSYVLLAIIKSMLRIQNTESKLRIALKQAETANIQKTQFLANVSHELKTPINVILSALQMSNIIAEDIDMLDINKKLNKYNHIMKQNSYRLIRSINNLIDTSKIDSAFMNVNRKNVNIVKIVDDITLSIASFVESKQIELIFDTDVEEKVIACDPNKIETIIFNLLSNAVKFTNPGGKINVSMFDKEDYIIISVQDTGIGISDDNKKKVFQKYQQIEDALHRNREGSGIGLYLVKSLVEMQGGKITIENNCGQGSNFIIKLPSIILDESEEKNKENIYSDYLDRVNVEFSDI
ncbi:MAG TPA: hybrid sensor histidine kinase/response regulator [Clostridiaceae bacterium]